MTFTRGLFIHPDATRGTTALESRQSLAGLIPGAGVLDGLTVSGTASWQYSVSAGHVATSRGIDTDGVVLFANDAPVLVDCSPAPGTGSRIDIIYAKHNDATTPNADPDSEAFAAVAEGVASGTPVAPEIPDGAVELARATVGAGATNTDHANVTISHGERLITTTLGGIMVTHSSAQRAAAYFNTTARPVFAWRTDTQTLDVAWGDGWKQIYPSQQEGSISVAQPNLWDPSRLLMWWKHGNKVTITSRALRHINSGNAGEQSRLYTLPPELRPVQQQNTLAASPRPGQGRVAVFMVEVRTDGGVFLQNTDPDFPVSPGTTYHFSVDYRTAS